MSRRYNGGLAAGCWRLGEIVADGPESHDDPADVEAEVVPSAAGAIAPVRRWPIVHGDDPDTIVVAGTCWTIDGLRVPPDEVTVGQIATWHAACCEARDEVVRQITRTFAYEYAIGRALYARRATMKAAKDRTWLKWLSGLPFSQPMAYEYIKVFEHRDQMLAGEQSSNALEQTPTLTFKKLRNFVRNEKREPKSGPVPPRPRPEPNNPAAPTPSVKWSWTELYALRDKVIQTIGESPLPVDLAHEVVTELLKKYGDPDWLQQRRAADRAGVPFPVDDDRIADADLVLDADADMILLPTSDAEHATTAAGPDDAGTPSAVSNSAPTSAGLPSAVPVVKVQQGPSLRLVDKYKPLKFADIVGQDDAVRVLQRQAMRDVPLRIILDGPSGSGKTSLAWLLARRFVCENRASQSPDPCEACETCKETKSMESDFGSLIQQVSAATGNSATAAKDVFEQAGFTRFIIVDEADEMKEQALRLVKMLDRHKKLSAIFCSCDAMQLAGKSAQFLNRLLKVDLATPSEQDVGRLVSRVASMEGIQLSDEDVRQICVGKDGHVRSPRNTLIELDNLMP